MIIMAIDAALRTGIATGEPGSAPTLEFVDFARPHDDHADIFGRAVKWMARRLADGPPIDLVVLEGVVPQYDKTIQAGLCGVLAGIANAKGIKVEVVAVQTWRAFVLGDGKLPKVRAKARAVAVVHQLGWAEADVDHNAAEAGCQWLWACSRVAPRLLPQIPLFMREAGAPAKKRERGAA